MENMLEKLWNEYFYEECAIIETKEQKLLLRRVVELQEVASAELSKEQWESVEKYVQALYESQGAQVKQAFFKGCRFTASFLIGLGNGEKK